MKIIKRILLGLIVLVLLIVIIGYIYLQNTKPDYVGELTLAGLKEPVEVLYDDYGVPHIYAQNEEDAYYALGYVHAQDRLFQMEMMRRAAGGRLAEVLGPDLLKTDKLFRTLGINKFAREHVEKYLSADTADFQKAAHAYQKGINQFIKTGMTPLEFSIMGIPKEEFTPTDIYLAAGFVAFGFAEGLRVDPILEKIRSELGNEYLKDLAVQTPANASIIKNFNGSVKTNTNDSLISFLSDAFEKIPVPLLQGSNGMVIAGNRTASGFPLLANDTHIGYSQPAVWYEAQLEYPGFRFYGHHMAGIPFGLIGQNNFCSWGITMFENDDIDFFNEEFDDNGKVKYKGEWIDITWRKEIIKIKGQVDLEIVIPETPHGSIINDVIDFTGEDKPVALSWLLNQNQNQALESAYGWSHSKNFSEFEKVTPLFSSPGINVMYGDVDGNIAWWAVAKLPIRPAHAASKFFLDGSSGKDDYLGFYDFSKNPHAVNPPWGYVYSANNQPDSVDGVLYPGYYYPRSRAGRIEELISQEKKWTMEDIKAIDLDVTSRMHADIAHEISSILKSINRSEFNFITTQLETWNGEHQADQITPTLYNNILSQIMHKAMADEISDKAFEALAATSVMKNSYEQFIKNENSPWWDNKKTEQKETRTAIVEEATQKTIEILSGILGKNPADWKWGKIHTLTHKHALDAVKPLRNFFNVGRFEMSGGSEVINNQSFRLDTTGNFSINMGPALRKITDFNNIENGITISPTGQSGNVMSKHYSDQAEMFATGKFRKMLMNREEIKSKATTLLLKPSAN